MATGAAVTEGQEQAKQEKQKGAGQLKLSTEEKQKLLEAKEREDSIRRGTLLTPEARLKLFAKLDKLEQELQSVGYLTKGTGTSYQAGYRHTGAFETYKKDNFAINLSHKLVDYVYNLDGTFRENKVREFKGTKTPEMVITEKNTSLWAEKRADSWLKEAVKASEEGRYWQMITNGKPSLQEAKTKAGVKE